MGQRAQVKIMQDNGTAVYLYTHNGARTLLKNIADSFNKLKELEISQRARFDSAYTARLIFEGMLREKESDFYGYGISAEPIEDVIYTVTIDKYDIMLGDETFSINDFCNRPAEFFTKYFWRLSDKYYQNI